MPSRPYAIESAAATAIVSAFGTVFLLPALRYFDQSTTLWWLFYVLATAMAANAEKQPLNGASRALIALIPALAPLAYIAFQVVVLGRRIGLSGLEPDNPNFWMAVSIVCAMIWPLVWLFSYGRSFLAAIVRWLVRKPSEAKV